MSARIFRTMNELFLKRMQDLLQEEYPAYLSAVEKPARRGMRINPLRISEEEFFRIMPLDTEKSPFASNGYYLKDQKHLGFTPAYAAGLFYIQEPSASAAVTVLDPQPGMKVLDLCAAPGSKSTQIAERLGSSGFLCVNEINSSRAKILLENIVRHGTSNTLVINSDPRTAADAFPAFFDAVLCDAPCSGEGMFRKNDEAAEQWSPDLVAACADRQKKIMHEAWRALRPGGRLVYSTCTFSREENEELIALFLADHPDMHIEKAEVTFGRPALPVTPEMTGAVRIFPMDGGEGHFICRMKKDGEAKSMGKTLASDPVPSCASAFLRENLTVQYPYLYCSKGRVYGGTAPFLDTGRCHVLSWQIRLGEVKNGRFEPAHPLFMSSFAPCRGRAEVTDEQAAAYLHGEELKTDLPKGWYAVTWHGYAMGGAHSDGRALKNKFPKSLRHRIKYETEVI